MKKIILVFLCITSQMVGQQISFKGKLLDQVSKTPVVYANISFLDTDKGISSQEDGSFYMNIAEKYLKGKIHISCLNYKDTIVFAKDVQGNVLYLQPKVVQLDEVVLEKRVDRSILLDKVKKKVHGVHSVGMRMLAKYFPNNPKKYKCCNYISKVAISFSKRHNKQSKFRVRVFDRDSKIGLPKNDLLNINLPITIKEGQLQVEVDLSNYDIEMPENGVFIAFEKLFIPFNEYGTNKNDPNSSPLYSPIIGFTKYKYRKEKDRLYYYVKGVWTKSALTKIRRFRKFAPAISLTLSN